MSKEEEYGIWNILPTIIGIVAIIFVIIYFSRTCNRVSEEFNKTKIECQRTIGKKIVLGKDTLMIVNYSIIDESCILSNGSEIKLELAKKLMIK